MQVASEAQPPRQIFLIWVVQLPVTLFRCGLDVGVVAGVTIREDFEEHL